MKDITTDLCDRLALLHLRYSAAFECPPSRCLYSAYASELEDGLRAEDRRVAGRVRALVDPAELHGSPFWATPLGRLLFAAGGYEGETVGQAFAAGVLGCSRQWVHELIARGVLGRDDSSPALVPVPGVRELLKAKLDELVK